jgi:hypothetical protein
LPHPSLAERCASSTLLSLLALSAASVSLAACCARFSRRKGWQRMTAKERDKESSRKLDWDWDWDSDAASGWERERERDVGRWVGEEEEKEEAEAKGVVLRCVGSTSHLMGRNTGEPSL